MLCSDRLCRTAFCKKDDITAASFTDSTAGFLCDIRAGFLNDITAGFLKKQAHDYNLPAVWVVPVDFSMIIWLDFSKR